MRKKNLRGWKTILLFLTVIASAAFGLQVYFSEVADIYLLSAVGLLILIFVVAFTGLEKVAPDARREAFGAQPGPDRDEVAALKLNALSDKRANQSKLIRDRPNDEIRTF